MTNDLPPLSSEVRALLDRERNIPSLSPAVRARVLAAARASLAAGPAPAPAPVAVRAPVSWTRWAAALTFAAAGAAAAITAYRLSAPAHHGANEPTTVVPVPIAAPAARLDPPPPAPSVSPAAVPAPEQTRAPDEGGKRVPAIVAREELRLLRQARAAVAREDFAAALPVIAEHTRYFRDGRLAEEREALRVKALAGLGRTDEARRAAAAFAARFPHSVLLPAVTRMTDGEP